MFIGYISAALAWKIIISKEKKNYISSKLNKTQCLLGTSDSSSNANKRKKKKEGFRAANGQFMCEFICKTDFKTYFILAVPIKCVPFLFRSGCCLPASHNLVSPKKVKRAGWAGVSSTRSVGWTVGLLWWGLNDQIPKSQLRKNPSGSTQLSHLNAAAAVSTNSSVKTILNLFFNSVQFFRPQPESPSPLST